MKRRRGIMDKSSPPESGSFLSHTVALWSRPWSGDGHRTVVYNRQR